MNFPQAKETTGNKVVLTRVDLSASGNYSCEVMGDSPHFSEDKKTKIMTVVGKTKICLFALLDCV